jgi:hypothetical protein
LLFLFVQEEKQAAFPASVATHARDNPFRIPFGANH